MSIKAHGEWLIKSYNKLPPRTEESRQKEYEAEFNMLKAIVEGSTQDIDKAVRNRYLTKRAFETSLLAGASLGNHYNTAYAIEYHMDHFQHKRRFVQKLLNIGAVAGSSTIIDAALVAGADVHYRFEQAYRFAIAHNKHGAMEHLLKRGSKLLWGRVSSLTIVEGALP